MKKFGFLLLSILVFYSCSKNSSDTTGPESSGNTVTDIDGNIYHTVTIGTQTWMVENLKVTKYRNGDAIPNVTDNAAWSSLSLTSGAYCSYQNSATNGNTYGMLYNYYAVSDSRKICPSGWHIATQAEFQTLATSVSNNSNALKAIGQGTGSGAGTNTSGFSALFAGYRTYFGSFVYLGLDAIFWSSTDVINTANAYAISLGHGSSNIYLIDYYNKGYGYSVRCIKD